MSTCSTVRIFVDFDFVWGMLKETMNLDKSNASFHMLSDKFLGTFWFQFLAKKFSSVTFACGLSAESGIISAQSCQTLMSLLKYPLYTYTSLVQAICIIGDNFEVFPFHEFACISIVIPPGIIILLDTLDNGVM